MKNLVKNKKHLRFGAASYKFACSTRFSFCFFFFEISIRCALFFWRKIFNVANKCLHAHERVEVVEQNKRWSPPFPSLLTSFRILFRPEQSQKEQIKSNQLASQKHVATIYCVKSVLIRSFSGLYFPTFGLNAERYSLSPRIQSECGKIQTGKTPNTDSFHVVFLSLDFDSYSSYYDGIVFQKMVGGITTL